MKQAKHVILRSLPSTPFYDARGFFEAHQAHEFFEARQASQLFEACQARRFMKQAKHANFLKRAKHAISWSTLSMRARKARKHAKYVGTQST